MIRVYVEDDLRSGVCIPLSAACTHYLYTVMRLEAGSRIEVFNGKDGGWHAECLGKRHSQLRVQTCVRLQPAPSKERHLYISGFKRMDWALEKATELGVTHIHPIVTQHSSVRHLSLDRATKILREASEQSQRYTIPEIAPLSAFAQALEGTQPGWVMHLEPWDAPKNMETPNSTCALWVGPEGGWSQQELTAFQNSTQIRPLCFPHLCLRAETAVIAGLSLMHHVALGDFEHNVS
jgi:16S rRNA (uracil1498-N3)-methyltransferase